MRRESGKVAKEVTEFCGWLRNGLPSPWAVYGDGSNENHTLASVNNHRLSMALFDALLCITKLITEKRYCVLPAEFYIQMVPDIWMYKQIK